MIVSQVGDTGSEQDFEDRFLQCFGLGDPDVKPEPRTTTRSDAQERDAKLKKQAKESPWYVSCFFPLLAFLLLPFSSISRLLPFL